MSQSHIGSRLVPTGRLYSVDNNTSHLFHFDITENCVLTGMAPSINVSTMTNGKFGGGIAIEEGTTNSLVYLAILTNLNIGSSYDFPNRRITKIDNDGTWKVEYTVDVTGTGILNVSSPINWTGATNATSVEILEYYLAPDSTTDFGLGRSSSGGGHLTGVGKKSYIYNNNATALPMAVRTSSTTGTVMAGSYMVWKNLQVEVDKGFSTSFVNGTRGGGILTYPANGINPSQGTVSFWYKPSYPSSVVTDQNSSPKLFQAGAYNLNSSFTIWNYNNAMIVYVKGRNGALWTGSAVTGQVFPQNVWTMITLTWNDKQWKIYKDGNLSNIFNSTESLGPISSNIFYIGGDGGNGGISLGKACNGVIDELRIDRVARSGEEIMQWHLSESPFYPRGVYTCAY